MSSSNNSNGNGQFILDFEESNEEEGEVIFDTIDPRDIEGVITEEQNSIWVTPEMAEDWLGLNTHNRKAKKRALETYEEAFRCGDWLFTGDAIRFSKNMVLLDGQHRLMTCVKTQIPFSTAIVVGLDDSTMECIDTGSMRTLLNHLQRNREKHADILASSVQWTWRILQSKTHVTVRKSPSLVQATQILEEYPELRKYGAEFKSYGQAGAQVSAFGALAAVCTLVSKEYPEEAEVFFRQLYSGLGCSAGDPAFALRNAIIASRLQRRRIDLQGLLMSYTSYAWRAHLRGRKISRFGKTAKMLRSFVGGPQWD